MSDIRSSLRMKVTWGGTSPCRFTMRVKWTSFRRVLLFTTPWTIQSVEFSRPEHWCGQPFPSLGIFPIQGSNPGLLHCRRILYQLSHQGRPWYLFFSLFMKGTDQGQIEVLWSLGQLVSKKSLREHVWTPYNEMKAIWSTKNPWG